MIVYVDDPMMFVRVKFKGYCHMWIVDGTHEELDTFARSIGLKTEWAQHKQGAIVKDFYHYDLSPFYRVRALLKGAQYMPLSQYVNQYRAMQIKVLES